MNHYTRDEVGIEPASSFFVSSAHQFYPRLSPHPELVGGFFLLVPHENSIFHFGTGNDPIGLRR